MSETGRGRASNARPPLADATQRVNNTSSKVPVVKSSKSSDKSSSRAHHNITSDELPITHARAAASAASSRNPVARARASQDTDPTKRHSQVSQASTAASSKRSSGYSYKTHIGPWLLGKTLGKGSSARVRLCKHRISGELAAVKIVPKKTAYLIQAGSLAELHDYDDSLPERINGEMRVPLSIEREVAILKLVDHPNVMKVYDIWENRSEIYLVLEYVEQGDLFDYINTHGRFSEEGAMFVFRQMMSALQYCHSFNICHRDLKPENILLTADNKVKIADFGMAALHQSADHRLVTACGSPHYAAPELLKHKHYRGDKADIWSLGIILYALLAACLPFDDPDIGVLLQKTKRGTYEIPEFLSPEAKDLIRRMLIANPDTRISIKDMWQHPLIRKYDYLDNLSTNGQSTDLRKSFHYTPLKPHEVDPHLVRQLRSMWHMLTEHQIKLKLMDSAKNDQKLFYWLLYDYRKKQLENFLPELTQSPSDYHHLHEPVWKKRVSTVEFNQPRADGTGRSVSRFTVISHVAETDDGTVQSYDPYNSSKPMRGHSQASHAKIVVHRTRRGSMKRENTHTSQLSRIKTGSTVRHSRVNSQRTVASRFQSPRNSMNSLHSSRQGTPYARPASRHKRGIDFSHIRRKSNEHGEKRRRGTPLTIPTEGEVRAKSPTSPTSPVSPVSPVSPPKQVSVMDRPRPKLKIVKPRDPVHVVNEEVRNFSHSIAKDCDEIFGNSMIADEPSELGTDDGSDGKRDSRLSFTIPTPTSAQANTPFHPWDTRPLPPLPPPKKQAPPIPVTAKTEKVSDKTRDGHQTGRVGKFVDQVNRLGFPSLMAKQDRRTVSAPPPSQNGMTSARLPAINENGRESESSYYPGDNDRNRIVSAPPKTPSGRANADGLEYLVARGDTIRVVNSPSATSPVPKPLNVRKKTADRPAQGDPVDERYVYMHGASGTDEPPTPSTGTYSSGPGKQKKSLWFKRSSKDSTSQEGSIHTVATQETQAYSMTSQSTDPARSEIQPHVVPPPVPAKKKGFGLLFWKSNKGKSENTMAIAGPDYDDSHSPEPTRGIGHKPSRNSARSWNGSESGVRNIEVQQNWLARLFGVKPATSYVCLAISRKRARQEIAILLKDWRRYGMRDIQVDKERNIVFARVGAKNYLSIKEVAFAAEIMTVIEHGKKGHLCIVRFTQERGAASSFHRVVDTVRTVFGSRSLLVADKRKEKMMIKTLNS
ncbi:putative serine/threonine-protein kinase HSL1 [Colletotrichum siamense]|nr:putative serine/threonine-protein kinase HSL1 [Colletotrichum siamense]KAI8151741.1 putative serine/threonine-protein kinase HSL1 [Colletotrichum sp. SAR 10_71]KAI8153213.1 putative serine/threonine-protein kinase HSL1 [Colletotrichum sp. SAR 10_70]KAI8174730.1 putative serine/threonine-protein kinase HSL1 [Colletotrichum sp. SAR 10_75]